MEVILEGDKLNSIEEFHIIIKKLLDLPEYYGANLDALWDCLTGWVETPLTLIWVNFEVSKVHLGDFADKALATFIEAEEQVSGFKIVCS